MTRRIRTLPSASAVGSRDLALSCEEWSAIEKAYGNPLTADVRERISAVTQIFLEWEVFERNAQPLKLAQDRIESIKSAADHMFSTLVARSDDAVIYAKTIIKSHFSDSRIKVSHDLFDSLAGVLTSLFVACQQALNETDQPDLPTWQEGESWNEWIRRLTKIVDEENLPSAASKGSDKANTHSPFVLFVEALQEYVPKDARRHVSKPALAAAINRARRTGGAGGNQRRGTKARGFAK